MPKPVLSRAALSLLMFALALLFAGAGGAARAHDFPYSYIELRAVSGTKAGLEATLDAPAIDFAHELGDVTPESLLSPTVLRGRGEAMFALVRERLIVEATGTALTPQFLGAEPGRDAVDIRLRLFYPWEKAPAAFDVKCRLFPYDPRHKTFLTLYEGAKVKQEVIFEGDRDRERLTGWQSTGDVARRFIVEGIRHIAIGYDHILFVIGLVLLPARLRHLLKIVTAFTLAHSITLALAALDLFNPPARLIEPTIALSIVFVGVHALIRQQGKPHQSHAEGTSTDDQQFTVRAAVPDLRLLFAFGFGLIHGFGFAGVLKELELPRQALVTSLVSFNVGVEIGQACIVLTVAPVLAWLYRTRPVPARQVVATAALVVVAAGGYWFVERVFL